MPRPSIVWALTLCLAMCLAGCVTPYRMDVAQGNIVTPEMVSQLRLGMTRSQVRFVLGTPMIADPFHSNRWDYYYSLHKGTDKQPQTRRLTVIFKGDALERMEGDLASGASGPVP